MKRVRCPKCENYLTFDETKYTEGQSLVFICEHCKKQFSIRLGKARKGNSSTENMETNVQWGTITVIENAFGFRQIFPLKEGDNVIGRHNVGTKTDIPIETSDMSMDRRHCIINVRKDKNGNVKYTLRDAPSLTGTFLFNDILNDKDRISIGNGAVITIGATTLILQTVSADSSYE